MLKCRLYIRNRPMQLDYYGYTIGVSTGFRAGEILFPSPALLFPPLRKSPIHYAQC